MCINVYCPHSTWTLFLGGFCQRRNQWSVPKKQVTAAFRDALKAQEDKSERQEVTVSPADAK